LDKTITVKFYRITSSARTQGVPFMDRLRQLAAIRENARVRRVNDIDYWMDKLTINNNVAVGRLCRIQTAHLPPQALPGGRLARLGVPAIGPHAIWQYEAEFSVMAIESTRTGVGIDRYLKYVRNICDCQGYGFGPVIDDSTLAAAQHGRIRELAVRVATPTNLEAVSAEQQQMKRGMVGLMGSQIATQIEVRFSVTAGDPDIQPGRFLRAARWLLVDKI
jgi:hypothetical protein